MPEIRFIMKVKYGYVQEWEFESAYLAELRDVIETFAMYLNKPKFKEIDITITPHIVEEEIRDE